MIENFCDYVAYISEHPHEKAPPITVREFYALQNHIYECAKCWKAIDKVLDEEQPEDPKDNIGFSAN